MTKQEREASSAGKKLALALWALEDYDGDPSDVLREVGYWLRQIGGTPRQGPQDALLALIRYYEGDGE